MRDYKDYKVWQLGQKIAVQVYELTATFSNNEKYGLISQIRRSAVSISSNIAEGCSRSSEKDFARFIEISIGSAFELESLLLLSKKLDYCKGEQIENIFNEITSLCKQLNSLRSKLKNLN